MVTIQTEKLTIEDFIRLYESEGPFEIIDGERILMSPTLPEHGKIVKRVVKALLVCEDEGKGEVFFEQPFVLVDKSQWVKGSRVPDVMYFEASRLKVYREQNPDEDEKPYALVPDIAVEVVSKTDSYTALSQKVDVYLRDGVKIIWVIDPRRQVVEVYQGSQKITLTEKDTLRGEEVIPGFEVPVARLFEAN